MGWGRGTNLFDGALDVFLKYVPSTDVDEVIADWYSKFDDFDWDCPDESNYANLLNPIRVDIGEIEPPCPVCGEYSMWDGECEGECYESRN